MTSLIKTLPKIDSPDSEEKKQPPTNLISKEGIIRRLKRSPEARARFVESNLSKELAFQIRALRDNKEWSQPELAQKIATSQNAISRLENPNYGKATITTLKKLAAVFDVGLVVRFVPFSQLVNWESGTPYIENGLSPESMDVPSFAEEEEAGVFENAENTLLSSTMVVWKRHVPAVPSYSILPFETPASELVLGEPGFQVRIGGTIGIGPYYTDYLRLARIPREDFYVSHLAQEGSGYSIEAATTSEIVGEAAIPVKKSAQQTFDPSLYMNAGSA